MRNFLSLAVLAALVVAGQGTSVLAAADEEGVALAIIYDTSGSMHDPVPDRDGRPTPKYVIASRALRAVTDQIQAYVTNNAGGPPRKVFAGVFTFKNNGAQEVVPFGPFDAQAIKTWAGSFFHPVGNTPLGNALNTAAQRVLSAPLTHKHVLILTDGMNTAGPDPAAVIPRLKARADQKGTSLSFHFIAFDVDAKVFEPVKRLGATVVGASDEKQLNAQLDYILQREILLEAETPKR
jgi:hypothetical protein